MQVCYALMQVCFYVLRLNYCQIFCVTYSLVLMYILNSLFCCLQVLHSVSQVFHFFPYIALFVNLYNTLPSLSLLFSFSMGGSGEKSLRRFFRWFCDFLKEEKVFLPVYLLKSFILFFEM